MAKKQSESPAGLDVPVGFKTIFWVAVGLTVLSLLVAVYLAKQPPELQNEQMKKIVETCDTTWKMGFGGTLGLLGGKRLP